ncbi:MAG TPA: alpha/beta hydrolase, partial [Flavisolibacter sp.]|nr:alpha/beta hydrolase [Flavisolibacter sp.]
QRTENSAAEQKSLPAETLLNVAYGKDSAQKMDIYLPANRTDSNTKVLVLIHGGGWASGDKSEFATAIPILKEKLPHYAIVNLNYRLANQTANHFPTQENDIKQAMQYILDKTATYHISSDLVLLGTSAGAHLALLQAYKHTDQLKPKAVISFFGPTDMVDMYNRQYNSYYQFALQLLVGGTPATKPHVFRQASPIYFVNRQSAPTLLLHGGKDGLVPPSQSKNLKEKLDKAGVPAELVIYPNEGHGWYGANQANSFDRIVAFLKKHVG